MEIDKVRLIEEVRKRPIIWDVRREKADNKWAEVADIIGMSVSSCKANWRSLCNIYRMERKSIQERIAKAKSEGKYDPGKNYNTWRLFDAMKFAFEGENQSEAQRDLVPNISDDENRSAFFIKEEIPDETIKNEDLLKQSSLLNIIHIKEEPEIHIDADTYPMDNEDSKEARCGQVNKEEADIKPAIDIMPRNLENNSMRGLSRTCSPNEQHKGENNSKVDKSDLDYSFLEKKTKLTRAEVQKRYREKLKQDKKRYEEYKEKARERTARQLKRDEMPLQRLETVRAKALLRYYNKKSQPPKRENDSSTLASTETVRTSSTNNLSSAKDDHFCDNGPSTSSVNSVKGRTHISKTHAKKITSEKSKIKLKIENHKLREQVKKLKAQLERSKRNTRKYQKRLQRSNPNKSIKNELYSDSE